MKKLLSTLLLFSLQAQAARFVVEAKKVPTQKELAVLAKFKIDHFSSKKPSVFNRTFVISGNVTKEELQKLPWVAHVEAPTELMKLSLEPAKEPSRAVQDDLYQYQWGLYNGVQTYYREKDDIHNIPMVGVKGEDIGWEKILPQLPKEKVIVAVLDSGVDLTHPELQGNLWQNPGECGKDPKIDNDGNKLAGDCHGWNFTADIGTQEAKSPQDIEGHGTHVAGIIGAAMNGDGIVGVNPNVSIMPVKVMKDLNAKSPIHSSESFARGIVYATDMGASIINLSLGWPRSLETKLLRDSVFYALGQGVVIVAAAGNNNSAEPLFPCAYDGVICTAASTLNGNFAGFTNYGSHVDTVAPGEGILSTVPTIFEPDFFAVPGYDLKSGTSQAAPVVAGLISLIKSQDPKISIDEILGRLYQAKLKTGRTKYVLGGEATFAALSQKTETPVIRPVLKRVRQIVILGERPESRLIVPVRNYGTPAENVEIKLESLSPAVQVVSEAFTIPTLGRSEVKELAFNLRVTDLLAESNVKVKVTIKVGEESLSYINELPVVRDIRADANLRRFGFTFKKNPLPVGTIRNNSVFSLITTIDSYVPSAKHEFYLKRTLDVEKKKTMELTFITKNGDKYVEAPKPILVNDATSLVNLIRIDLNADGKEDYLIQSVVEADGKKHLQFSFYNADMNPLWENFNDVKVVIDTTIQRLDDLTFIKINDPDLGAMLIPSFFTEGQLPKADQVVSSWGRLDTSRELRFYYLDPQIKDRTFKIRSLTTNIWKEKVKKALGTKWFETVMVEQLLPTTTEDAKAGRARIFFSVGELTKRKLYIATVSGKDLASGKALPQLVLQTEGVDSLYAVTPRGLETVGDVYLNVYDRARVRVVTTKEQVQAGDFVYRHVSETDIVTGHLVSFENGKNRFSVLQSREQLIGVSIIENKIKITQRPKLRYSFLSQEALSEMYNPVIYRRDGVSAPAIYVDSTQVTANRLNLFEEQDGGLISTIKNSLTVPSTCKAMLPSYNYESETSQFVFLCLDEVAKEWTIRTLDMK